MHNKYDFEGQKADDTVCYLPIKEIAELSGRCRGSVFRDITLGRLPAVWHAVFRNGKKHRAYLVHPTEVEKYIRRVKGRKRVNWGAA